MRLSGSIPPAFGLPARALAVLQACCALCAMLALLTAAPARAAAPAPAPLSPQDTLDLTRVAAYLNGIRTMTARFSQITGTGAHSTGRMWVARPGKMRFEYDPPNPITLLADSFYVYYWDKELQQVSKVGLKSTPAWFFLREPIDFGADVIVTQFSHLNHIIRIRVVQSAAPDDGSLTMFFSDDPLTLRQWTVVDQQGKTTTVTLSDLQYGMALDPNLFQYRDPNAGYHREN
jgi:outer membrane lipoprotein-sorting protein